ncbi:hypothetical protein N7490_004213 [Penicillium lividum]|nr:hypothetical protein N7490_004213 [Penicillium lividum]
MIQRNGGGIASTALRDIVTGNVLVGIKEIMVIHHTDCGALQTHSGGLAKFIEEKIKEQGTWKEGALEAAKNLQAMAGFPRSEGQDDETVLINSVKSDLRFLNDHPFVRTDVHVSGYIYEMETGKLRQIYLE